MRNVKRAAAAVGTSALMLVGVAGLPGNAFAATVHPDGCPADPGYSFSAVTHTYHDMVSSVEGTRDTTIGIALLRGRTVTGTVTGTVTTEESAIFASAKESVSLSLAKAITTSVTYSGTWKVPHSTKVGYLHAGADEKHMKWTYGSYNGACKYHVSRHGTATFPYHVPTFWHTS